MQDVRGGKVEPLDNMHVSIIRNADRFADRKVGLGCHGGGVDDQDVALPMTN